ncbi:hypothetical protein VaNZ11_013680 [Volvox africanus]|uniref:Myeloid leukemia factor n=1 Tax=Volvox africanus TaxID=51714 RepID=A0ABQ5SHX1_9CHLO|nr:hypothetical protein VaNZ11_013680 [Volvox africanus]
MFGRGGPFGSMFGNDPFFSDPFSHMDRMMNTMLNDPFFANPLGMGTRMPGVHVAQPVQNQRVRQPVIEEVDDVGHTGRTTAQDEPIVEEPDDEPSPQDRAAQRQRRHSPPRQQVVQPHAAPMDPFSQLLGAFGGVGAGGGSSFMISSSSFTSMGPGGMSYQASSTTRVGPGGVRETQAVVRDGRSRTESVTISRGLGDGRQRTLVRTRDGITGREDQLEDLQGLREHEAETFDEHWRHQAERNLPGGGGFGAVSSRVTGGGLAASAQQRPLALPPATSNTPIIPAAAGPSSNMPGLYDSAGLSTVQAQRGTYVQPPSPAAGRGRQPSGGETRNTGASAGGVSGRGGPQYVSGNGGGGPLASRSGRSSSALDGQTVARQQPQQGHSGAGGRIPAGSMPGYQAGPGSFTQPRYGY